MIEWLLLGVSTATAATVWRLRHNFGEPASLPRTALPQEGEPWPEPTLPVLNFQDLVQQTSTGGMLTQVAGASGLSGGTWQFLIEPVIENVARLVQLLPASESHHHAQPGGLWIHTCETLGYAVQFRNAFVLPPGRDADDVARDRHRWTAGIIVAALLHDVGKTVTDVRVRLYGPQIAGKCWRALAGTMEESGAIAYAVGFPSEAERDYRAHQRLGGLLLQRLVPADALIWIGEDKPLLDSLMQYLMGEADGSNPIAKIVAKAEAESVKHNLLAGPRTRFASAHAVPLIERLMDALRRMLADGSHLPLNRPGAAGYVWEGEIWFAAARLANAVRDYLMAHESAAGIPGEDKNDRLFDVWQDYGACLTNPATGRALFGGRIELDAGLGTSYELPAMLRFPMELLYPSSALYPKPMSGRIVPISVKALNAKSSAMDATVSTDPDMSREEAPRTTLPAPVVDSEPAPPPDSTSRASSQAFLEEADTATRSDLARPPPVAEPRALAPVTPSLKLPDAAEDTKPIPERALAFMQWLQTQVASGGLPYNQAGAFVHFVRHGEVPALLLVSPVIFQRYEEALREPTGANPGLATQRAFCAAGWHLRATGGRNIWSYQVMRAGRQGGSLLNGFVLLNPERFFAPVPPLNERLIAWNNAPAPGKMP